MGFQNHQQTPPQSLTAAVVSPLKSTFLGVALVSGVVNILALTSPLFMLQVYDRVLASGSLPTLVGLALLALGLYGFQCLLDIIRARVLIRIGEDFDMRYSGRVHDAVVRLPLVNRMPGDGLQPLRDLDNVRGFLSGTGPTAFFDLPWMPLYLGICFLFHVWIGVTALMRRRAAGIAHDPHQHLFAKADPRHHGGKHGPQPAAGSFAPQCRGRAGHGAWPLTGKRWQNSNEAYLAANRKAGDVAGGLGNLAKSLRVVLQSAILAVGAWLVIRQEASGGVMIASSIMMGRALAPVDLAISNWKSFVAARQSWARLRELFAQMPANAAAMALPKPEKELRVENVTIVPPGERKPTVTGLSFVVTAGNALGVIGPSGSGKSTLARILTGAWMPAVEQVRLDGASFDQWDRETLGRHIGYLPQGVELFDGTIGENISRFDDNPDPEALIAAARAAGAHELILRFEKGYDSDIGEAGSALSAGQRQRIGLARALYGNPFIVVLDEPNANLDAEGEAAVVRAITSVKARGGIAVVVAHRPSAIGAVDYILMMEEGRMKAFGPRDEVLSKVLRVPQAQAAKGFAASAQTVSPLRVVANVQLKPALVEDVQDEQSQEGDADAKH